MGKWTLDYHDDVLREKFKSMVNGAINRAKLEKDEPKITYEAFVSELDIGDSFTSSLVDILVKELAERRSRANISDRRLISERTAKALRLQATRAHVYRDRSAATSGLRRLNNHDYLFDMERSEDDEGDASETTQVYELGGVPEGVRLGHNLYEAYVPTVDTTQDLMPQASSSSSPNIPPQRVTSPRPLSPPLRPSRGFGGSLTRQQSIRRPARTRVIDFNEFTTRLRHTHRSNSEQAASEESLRSEDSADGTWRFSSSERSHLADAQVYLRPRRFFPLAAWADPHSRGDSDTADTFSGAGNTNAENAALPQMPYPSAYHHQSSPHIDLSTFTADRPIVPPRLRRGGLRAPESLLTTAIARSGSHDEALATPGGSTSETGTTFDDSLAVRRSRHGPESLEHDEGPQQLLTPRSITPTEDN